LYHFVAKHNGFCYNLFYKTNTFKNQVLIPFIPELEGLIL